MRSCKKKSNKKVESESKTCKRDLSLTQMDLDALRGCRIKSVRVFAYYENGLHRITYELSKEDRDRLLNGESLKFPYHESLIQDVEWDVELDHFNSFVKENLVEIGSRRYLGYLHQFILQIYRPTTDRGCDPCYTIEIKTSQGMLLINDLRDVAQAPMVEFHL